MEIVPGIALQLRWHEIQYSVHVAGVDYSPDVFNDINAQANRAFRAMIKDTSEYEMEDSASSDEVDEYVNSTIEALSSLFGEEVVVEGDDED